MNAFIEALASPEARALNGVPVDATHVAIGATVQPWNDPPIRAYTVRGVLVEGRFVPIPGTEVYTDIRDTEENQDLTELLSNATFAAAVAQLRAKAAAVQARSVAP